jgi:imidazolonepropionase-like amidohydrolase
MVADKGRFAGTVKAAQAGVVIGFGTDAGSPVVGHDVVAPEMAVHGRDRRRPDNYAAIRSATSVAAQINRVADRLGTLEAGKLADVIVVDGDPRADITPSRRCA